MKNVYSDPGAEWPWQKSRALLKRWQQEYLDWTASDGQPEPEVEVEPNLTAVQIKAKNRRQLAFDLHLFGCRMKDVAAYLECSRTVAHGLVYREAYEIKSRERRARWRSQQYEEEDVNLEPPTEEWIKTVCKLGKEHFCCRYLTMGANGWSCEKFTKLGRYLDVRVENKNIVARGDNCHGKGSR